MNLALTLISVIVLLFFVINQYIKYKRFKYISNLNVIYEKMEMHFVNNDIILKRDYVELLKIFKNFTVNPEYLDIQILLLFKIASEKNGSLKKDSLWFDRTLNSLDKNFQDIFEEFDDVTNKIINVSYLKPDFIYFIFKHLIKYKINSKTNSVTKFLKELQFVKRNDEVISYSGMKLSFD